jgi:hypothetical protein
VISDPVTANDPETTTLFFAIIPLRETNSFIFYYFSSLSLKWVVYKYYT